MKITLCGKPSAGKGTLAHNLAKKFELKYYGIGVLKRQVAESRGQTIEAFNEWSHQNPKEGHALFDDEQRRIGKEQDNIIFDGRMSFYFIPDSIKIYLDCDVTEAARRRFEQMQTVEQKAAGRLQTVEEVEAIISERLAWEKEEFLKEYNVDVSDLSQFDIVIDTTKNTQEETFAQAVRAVETFLARIN